MAFFDKYNMFNVLNQRFIAWIVKIKKEKLSRILYKIIYFLIEHCLFLILCPITLIIHLFGYRRLTVIGSRIGHLISEVDCFLKERVLENDKYKFQKYFIAIPRDEAANKHLLDYWKNHILVIDHPVYARLIIAMSKIYLMKHSVSEYVLRIGKTAKIYEIYSKWGSKKPIIELDYLDKIFLKESLKKLGIPDDAWYVCVHVREPGYSILDEHVHSHRNSNIKNLKLALEVIALHGGWSIRMGEKSTTSDLIFKNTIDYSNHKLRSERLDIALCATCRFFFGNSSGLAFVSAAFGVPSALANMIPMSTLGLLKNDISIPKLLVNTSNKEYIKFDKIFNTSIGNYRFMRQYLSNGITPIENTQDELAELISEMILSLNNELYYTDIEINQLNKYHGFFKCGHYSYGSNSKISKYFLRKYDKLF